MITAILVNLIGIVSFLYLFWRRLKDDYLSSLIFSTAFYVVFGVLAGGLLAGKFFPAWWFWAALAGAMAGFGLGVFRFRLKFFETFEGASLGLFPWLALFFLADSVGNSSPFSLALSFFIFALIVSSCLLDSNYKNFVWYKSGKIGFTGLAVTGTFFLLRAAIAFVFPFVLSFVGKFEVFLSGAVAFALFLLLFNLSRYEQ